MEAISDGDRELWLSRYLDGELDDDAAAAVAEKLRTDETWRAEFDDLKRSDRAAAAALRRYCVDDGFSARVVEKLEAQPRRPSAAAKGLEKAVWPQGHRLPRRPRARALPRLFRLAAVVALGVCGVVAWRLQFGPPDTQRRPRVAAANQQPPATAPLAPAVTVAEELRSIALPDGSRILARRGATFQAVDSRTLKLDGEAFLRVVRSQDALFTVHARGHAVHVLGTCFDLKTSAGGVHVRVAEGRVRVQSPSGKTADACAGTEILPDLRTQPCDVREISAAWKHPDAGNLAAPWPQVGGSPGHTNITPLAGPANLVANRELFFRYPEGATAPETGAVVSARNRVYVVLRYGADEARLAELAADGPARGAWRTVAAGAAPGVSPVITPRGLLAAALVDGSVRAYDTETGREAWSHKEESAVRALCAAYDGTVLLCTGAGLVALDGGHGGLLWRCEEARELPEPAAVLPGGMIRVTSASGSVHVVDMQGRPADGKTASAGFVEPSANSVRDGAGAVFEVSGRGVAHSVPLLSRGGQGGAAPQLKPIGFSTVADGEIVRHGLAIAPGKLIVTTTRGIQVFE